MPRARASVTTAFTVGEAHGFLIASRHRDGALSDINLIMAKHGSTLNGLCDSLATAISTGLRHGVPLATFVRSFTGLRFPPGGPTDDPEIPQASSVIDYIVRRLAADYLPDPSRPDASRPAEPPPVAFPADHRPGDPASRSLSPRSTPLPSPRTPGPSTDG